MFILYVEKLFRIKGKIDELHKFHKITREITFEGFKLKFEGNNFIILNKSCTLQFEEAKKIALQNLDKFFSSLAFVVNQPKINFTLNEVEKCRPKENE